MVKWITTVPCKAAPRRRGSCAGSSPRLGADLCEAGWSQPAPCTCEDEGISFTRRRIYVIEAPVMARVALTAAMLTGCTGAITGNGMGSNTGTDAAPTVPGPQSIIRG